jgi:uncharacterized protein (TIGR00299 family) protein
VKHLHLECVGGASGDMVLGALVALGADLDALRAALQVLPLGPFTITAEPARSRGITGTRVSVEVADQPEAGEPAEPEHAGHGHHHHDHAHGHAHDSHVHAGDVHDHAHDHDHAPHRALSEIVRLLESAGLPAEVTARAVGVFCSLGHAEAKVHGVPVADIHFHEVGAADSIIDITGACWALEHLGITSVSVGPIPLGHGAIRCAHGVYPNPAPATIELIQGLPVVQTDEPFELVTPTGAALLAGWRTAASIPSGAVLVRAAYGVGRRELQHRPNVLRASLYDVTASAERDTCLVVECTLDDTTPELIGVLMDDVLAAGALDVTCTPVTMKKQRPGVVVSVLTDPERREAVIERLFRGSTTFGVREYMVERTKLARAFETVVTPYGPVRVKVGTWRGEVLTRSPEMADCQRVAAERGVAVRAVYEAARQASP